MNIYMYWTVLFRDDLVSEHDSSNPFCLVLFRSSVVWAPFAPTRLLNPDCCWGYVSPGLGYACIEYYVYHRQYREGCVYLGLEAARPFLVSFVFRALRLDVLVYTEEAEYHFRMYEIQSYWYSVYTFSQYSVTWTTSGDLCRLVYGTKHTHLWACVCRSQQRIKLRGAVRICPWEEVLMGLVTCEWVYVYICIAVSPHMRDGSFM